MRKRDSESTVEESVSFQRPPITHSNSMWLLRKPLVDEPEDIQPGKDLGKEPVKEPPVKPASSRSTHERSMTASSFWPGRMNTKDESKEPPCAPPKQRAPTKSPSRSRSRSRSDTLDGGEGKSLFAGIDPRANANQW